MDTDNRFNPTLMAASHLDAALTNTSSAVFNVLACFLGKP